MIFFMFWERASGLNNTSPGSSVGLNRCRNRRDRSADPGDHRRWRWELQLSSQEPERTQINPLNQHHTLIFRGNKARTILKVCSWTRCVLAHPEEIVFHADGELVAAQPQYSHRREGKLGDTTADAGELTTDQLLPVQRSLTHTHTHTHTHRHTHTHTQTHTHTHTLINSAISWSKRKLTEN